MVASIEDVARLAGVSVATVSRALRGLPNVAPSTRDRVRRAAEELSYVADPHASRLAARRTATIGLAVPVLGQWYYAQLFSGAEGAVVAAGYDILPFVLAGEDVRARFLDLQPFRKRVDGLVVVDVPFTGAQFAALHASGTPLVSVGVQAPGVPSLGVDNIAAARAAAHHVIDLGHTRVAVISALPDDPLHVAAPSERLRGIELEHLAHGVPLDPALIAPGNFSYAGGAEAMQGLLRRDPMPTAVLALSDEMAIGALRVARDAGLDVPGDLSVVGFDDNEVAEYVGLTTVHQPVVEQGERAVQMLLRHIADPDLRPTHDLLPTELVVRATTAPPPAGASRPPP